MKLARIFGCGLWLTLSLVMTQAVLAADDTLLPYAVNINRTPQQPWPGYGIYLGNGFVLTAAHVVGHAAQTHPSVVVAEQSLPATVIKEGQFEGIDLTLLSISQETLPDRIRLRKVTLCMEMAYPNAEVIVVVPGETAHSRILSPRALPADVARKFNTVIKDVARTGNSGSGVFDARSKCLMGIMSRKIQTGRMIEKNGRQVQKLYDVAKYFVAADKIREFIPAEIKF